MGVNAIAVHADEPAAGGDQTVGANIASAAKRERARRQGLLHLHRDGEGPEGRAGGSRRRRGPNVGEGPRGRGSVHQKARHGSLTSKVNRVPSGHGDRAPGVGGAGTRGSKARRGHRNFLPPLTRKSLRPEGVANVSELHEWRRRRERADRALRALGLKRGESDRESVVLSDKKIGTLLLDRSSSGIESRNETTRFFFLLTVVEATEASTWGALSPIKATC